MNRIILTDNAIRVVNLAYVEKLIDATALREITTKIRELPDGLVRCENCVHWKDEGFDSAGKCELWNIVFEYDWFCADGERREEP